MVIIKKQLPNEYNKVVCSFLEILLLGYVCYFQLIKLRVLLLGQAASYGLILS